MCTKDQHLSAMICGHTFHTCCIEEYATSCQSDLHNIRCPTCRKTTPEMAGLAADLLACHPMAPQETGGASASGHQPAAVVPSSSSEDGDDSEDGDEMDVDDDDAAPEEAGDEMDVDDVDAVFRGLFEASDDAADEPPVVDALPTVALVAKAKTKAKA